MTNFQKSNQFTAPAVKSPQDLTQVDQRIIYKRQHAAQRMINGAAARKEQLGFKLHSTAGCGILPRSTFDMETGTPYQETQRFAIELGGNYRAKKIGCQVCKSAWACAFCSSVRSYILDSKLSVAMHTAIEKGLRPIAVTFTAPHTKQTDVSKLIEFLRKNIGLIKRSITMRDVDNACTNLTGNKMQSVSSLEITYGLDNGWHPHIHETWFIPVEYDITETQKHVLKKWTQYCTNAGYLDPRNKKQAESFKKRGFHVTELPTQLESLTYLVKSNGSQPKKVVNGKAVTALRSLSKEMTSAQTKQAYGQRFTYWELCDNYNEGCKESGLRMLEYLEFTRNKQQIVFSRSFWTSLGLEHLTDEQFTTKAVELFEAPSEDYEVTYLTTNTTELASLQRDGLTGRYLQYLSNWFKALHEADKKITNQDCPIQEQAFYDETHYLGDYPLNPITFTELHSKEYGSILLEKYTVPLHFIPQHLKSLNKAKAEYQVTIQDEVLNGVLSVMDI